MKRKIIGPRGRGDTVEDWTTRWLKSSATSGHHDLLLWPLLRAAERPGTSAATTLPTPDSAHRTGSGKSFLEIPGGHLEEPSWGLEGSQDHTKSRLPSRKHCESGALLRATLQKLHQSHSPGCTSKCILLETSQEPANLHLLVLLPTVRAQPARQHSCKTLPVSGNLRFQDQSLLACHIGKSSAPVGSWGTTDNGGTGVWKESTCTKEHQTSSMKHCQTSWTAHPLPVLRRSRERSLHQHPHPSPPHPTPLTLFSYPTLTSTGLQSHKLGESSLLYTENST